MHDDTIEDFVKLLNVDFQIAVSCSDEYNGYMC